MMATSNAIDSNIPIEVSLGGTGVSTITAKRLVIGAGTGAVTVMDAGLTGQTVMGSTGNVPTWTSSPSFGGSVTAGTTITASSGDVTITSGDLKLSASNSVKVANVRHISAFGTDNIFVGGNTGDSSITGEKNVVLETVESVRDITSGNGNITMCRQVGITTGSYNISQGYEAMGSGSLAAVTGSYNIALYTQALREITSGSYNIAFGYGAGENLTTHNSSIYFGRSGTGISATSNRLQLGVTGTGNYFVYNKCFIAGIRGVTTDNADAIDVLIDSTATGGQLGTVSSSIRFKDDVKDIGDRSQEVYKLRPVSFVFKEQKSPVRQYGLIAEEVEKVLPELVIKDNDGECETVKYREIPILLLNELIKLKSDFDTIEEESMTLEAAYE